VFATPRKSSENSFERGETSGGLKRKRVGATMSTIPVGNPPTIAGKGILEESRKGLNRGKRGPVARIYACDVQKGGPEDPC